MLTLVADLRSRLGLYRSLTAVASGWRERQSVAAFAVQDFAARLLARLARGRPFSREVSVDLRGARHFLALCQDEESVLEQLYVTREYEQVPEFVPQRGWTVVDLGANTGMFAVQQARRGAHVHAVEPNPDCYRRLRRAVEANGVRAGVNCYPVAVGGAAGRAELVVDGASVAGSLYPGHVKTSRPSRRFEVSVLTLDDLCASIGPVGIDLLKIDVEAAELDVLRAGRKAVAAADRIIVECHSPALAAGVRALLEAAGFSLRRTVDTYPEGGYSTLYFSVPGST